MPESKFWNQISYVNGLGWSILTELGIMADVANYAFARRINHAWLSGVTNHVGDISLGALAGITFQDGHGVLEYAFGISENKAKIISKGLAGLMVLGLVYAEMSGYMGTYPSVYDLPGIAVGFIGGAMMMDLDRRRELVGLSSG